MWPIPVIVHAVRFGLLSCKNKNSEFKLEYAFAELSEVLLISIKV